MTNRVEGKPFQPAPTPAAAWAGEFGNAYTKRNQVPWQRRAPFWDGILNNYDRSPRSVLEVGCNAGWNLSAIRKVAPWANICGIDINAAAVRQAKLAGLDAYEGTIDEWALGNPDSKELVFTCGVLIHMPQPELEQMMRAIIEVSSRWVLAIEYHADEPTHVHYRGRDDMLWRRPFGRMYEEMGLRPVAIQGPTFLDKMHGFDDCTAYLLEKQ